MTTNKKDLSTTADGADIFVLSQAGSSFTNNAKLTTSGALASPIRGAANGLTIANKGTLTTSGDGSPGVTVGDLFGTHYDNVTVSNYGTINASGNLFDDGVTLAFPDGIDTYGNNERLINYGTISVASPDGAGMASIGMNCHLTNFGAINAGGAGLVVDTIDGTGGETGNTVINYGQIHTTADGNFGIVCFTSDNVVKNFGTIQADGVFSYGIGLDTAGNHGENYGTILATGDLSRGVLLTGEGSSFDNYGTIRTTGQDSIGARFSGEDLPGTDGGTFVNHGKIISAGWAVRGALADDRFVNYGSLIGKADMGGGDDTFVAGKGGSLSGVLTLGAGDDLIVFEKGGGSLTVADFNAGAGTDDVIDLSAFGYSSFAEVMSHASQSGADVVLKLGGKDQIVLDNVTLSTLAADDFTFAATTFAQSFSPVHVPQGENLFG